MLCYSKWWYLSNFRQMQYPQLDFYVIACHPHYLMVIFHMVFSFWISYYFHYSQRCLEVLVMFVICDPMLLNYIDGIWSMYFWNIPAYIRVIDATLQPLTDIWCLYMWCTQRIFPFLFSWHFSHSSAGRIIIAHL